MPASMDPRLRGEEVLRENRYDLAAEAGDAGLIVLMM